MRNGRVVDADDEPSPLDCDDCGEAVGRLQRAPNGEAWLCPECHPDWDESLSEV